MLPVTVSVVGGCDLRGVAFQGSDARGCSILRQLDCTPQTVVIDVRGQDEFDGPLGHIPGARNIVLSELWSELHSLSELKETPLVFVCKTDKRSAKAAQLLRDAGFQQISVLRGGMEGWQRSGYPVERRNVV